MPTQNRSTRLDTAYSVLDSYSTLSVEALLAPLSDDFTHQVLPESLGMPLREKDAFAAHAGGITSVFSKFSMVPQTVFEDPNKNSVIVYAKMIGELVDLGPWENECIIMMKMSEDGRNVVESKEFVDSAKARLLKEKLTARMEAKKAEALFTH